MAKPVEEGMEEGVEILGKVEEGVHDGLVDTVDEIERTAERVGKEVRRTALSLRERFCEEVEKDILRQHKKGTRFEDCSEAPVGLRYSTDGGGSVTGGPGSPGIPVPGTAPDAGSDSPPGRAGATPVDRAPARFVGLPNQFVSLVWSLVRAQLDDDELRKALVQDLNAGEEAMLDQLFAEQVADEVRRRTGLPLPAGAVAPGSRFRAHQDVVDGLVERVLADEAFRSWREQNPAPAAVLDPAAPGCASQPCIHAVPRD